MKAYFILCLLFLGTHSKSFAQSTIVGGNQDKHGCLPSAGYQWSELNKDCIRPFELKLQLSNKSHSYNCGVLFSKDKKKVELFCKEGVFMLKRIKNKNDFYLSKNGWVFEKNKNRWMVKSKTKQILYQ
ncbi:hypothetical protein V7S79_09525 [Aquirufa sp. ROCK-SH2]